MKPIPLEVTMMKRIGELNAERIHDLNQIGGLQQENARLKAEVEELKSQPDPLTAYLYADTLRRDDIKTLKAHIERLTKAVMHSPAAQLKLKELEGKTTFEEINPKEAENASLKAEAERLKMSAYNRLSMRIEIDKLNARIERLIKAGDLMADGINGDYNYSLPCIEAWEAAKKGGQSNG
jgi:predicted RNase H-like nuclease (RuvC/YqgF family)